MSAFDAAKERSIMASKRYHSARVIWEDYQRNPSPASDVEDDPLEVEREFREALKEYAAAMGEYMRQMKAAVEEEQSRRD